jgi:predicted nucleic acid-binding protein
LKALLDTSTLVAALVDAHPEHERCRPWMEKVCAGNLELVVASHSLAELFAVLSTLPVRPRLTPALARRLVRENVERHATIVTLSAADYRAVLDDLAERGLSGGVVYDALIARAAVRAGADRLVTLNSRDLRRAWPEGHDRVIEP